VSPDRDLAARAIRRFGGDPASLEFVQDVENAVWRFRRAGATAYLRLTPAAKRDETSLRAELAWMAHLHAEGFRLAPSVASERAS